MKPKVLLGVDELTLVLSIDITTLEDVKEWQPSAESMISEFVKLSKIESVFGEKKSLDTKIPAGYKTAYEFGLNPFYFAIAYHPLCPIMGVIVKFSAYAWNSFCSRSSMNIKSFLSSIKSNLYKFRLSRVDFTVDYQNWDISVNQIYRNLIDGKWEIHDINDRKNSSKITAYEVNSVVNTFYVGSKKTGTRLFLRVYNKKLEQLENFGYRYTEASKTLSWIRFEAVFKGTYAHQLTNLIDELEENNLCALIANKITEKFRFYDLSNEKNCNFSQILLETFTDEFMRLKLESPRNNDLISSIYHLIEGSGLFSTMYKCEGIWNKEAPIVLLENLYKSYSNSYKPNEDVKLWLKKNKGTLEKENLNDIYKDLILSIKQIEKNKENINEPLEADIDNTYRKQKQSNINSLI